MGQAHLSDSNAELVDAYLAIRDEPDRLIDHLRRHARLHGKEHYYHVRDRFRPRSRAGRAARFIYLNRTCYNGLYRVNSKGAFNVPMGRYKNPRICDAANIRQLSAALQNAEIASRCYGSCKPGRGDLVYCDPPYDETYDAYTAGKFGREEQVRLSEACLDWARQGAKVIVSNSCTPLVKELYRSFGKMRVEAPRHINRDGAGRKRQVELILYRDGCELAR